MDSWVETILAHPITKLPAKLADFPTAKEFPNACVYLKNTIGFHDWDSGQKFYESWEVNQSLYEKFLEEIEYDRPVYSHIKMLGRILDVGGGAGTVREFLDTTTEFISVDPYIDCLNEIPLEKKRAYTCLSRPLNFIAACAEFLPFQSSSFDYVHMRSMIDHLHSPDLALLEAWRVLKPDGKLVVGLFVEGGKSNTISKARMFKNFARAALANVGINRYKDHHTFHPTFEKLKKLITDNGFKISDVYWQPFWKDTVVYITSVKA
jgi:ubiquinone/menaquinone biosynthesis C-methylase UbiE